MGALAPSSLWLPRDDLLLKQGIEGGASLESLAKGAKRFSRKFTLQELQERWYALLYDPVVSAEAAVHMFELDLSASAAQSKSHKQSKHMSRKRKTPSVRQCYYNLHKRICNDPFDLMDMDFLDGIETCDENGNPDDPPSTGCFIVDQVSNGFGNSQPVYGERHTADVASPSNSASASAFHGELNSQNRNLLCEPKRSPPYCQDTDNGAADACSPNFGYSPMPEMPSWGACEDFSESALADALGIREQPVESDVANEIAVPGGGTMCSVSNLIGQMPCDNTEGSSANDEYFKELSHSLLNCSTAELLLVDELLAVDVDGNDMMDKSYTENSNSLLLEFPDGNDASNAGVTETPVAQISSGAHVGEMSAKGLFTRVDHHLVGGSSEAQKLSSALKVINPAFPEKRNGVISCAFNAEDPEIPNNDDVFLPFRIPSMTNSPIGDTDFDTYRYGSTSSVNETIIMSELEKCDVPEDASGAQTETHAVLYELPCSEIYPLAYLKHHSSNEGSTAGPLKECIVITEQPNNPNQEFPGSLIPNHDGASDSLLRFQRSGAGGSKWEFRNTSLDQNHEAALYTEPQQCIEMQVPDSVSDSPLSDEEEFSCDSDGDVPYCSDVEAMILDMDLIPDDEDVYRHERVAKYQNEEAARTIMRLEQAADACMQRAMSGHGAYAVLYGRHSKHFIKKTEVLLGRATNDVSVDIDLGKEGHAAKISRRQATIKMDSEDGKFQLKNYGKQSIYINGKEVACGEEVVLVSGSLLEVRGIAFIFEINRRYVKHHLLHNLSNQS